ncbi:MAG: trypsin-like serine peptidase, partial [Porticoccaceae bacterium]
AHVLFDTKTGLPFTDCSYRPQNRRLKSIAFAEVSPHSYQPNTDDKMRQSETDIVFVALRRSLQQKPLHLALPQQAQTLQLLGYNPSNERITISGQCHAYRSSSFVSEHLLLHNCDAESGSSGGPLLEKTTFDGSQGIQNTVVAIHGGTLSNSGQYAPGARAQPERWINQARKVDAALLQRLENFIAYLGKDSAH